jgi:hypothetical protein
VKKRLCRSIFLQIHLVHVFQSFDRHGDGGSMVSALWLGFGSDNSNVCLSDFWSAGMQE